eukprot:2722257-Pyramimonas_sp.AAC.1
MATDSTSFHILPSPHPRPPPPPAAAIAVGSWLNCGVQFDSHEGARRRRPFKPRRGRSVFVESRAVGG